MTKRRFHDGEEVFVYVGGKATKSKIVGNGVYDRVRNISFYAVGFTGGDLWVRVPEQQVFTYDELVADKLLD